MVSDVLLDNGKYKAPLVHELATVDGVSGATTRRHVTGCLGATLYKINAHPRLWLITHLELEAMPQLRNEWSHLSCNLGNDVFLQVFLLKSGYTLKLRFAHGQV